MAYCDWCATFFRSDRGIHFVHSEREQFRGSYGIDFHICGEECKKRIAILLKKPSLMNKTQQLFRWGNMINNTYRAKVIDDE